MKEEVDDSEVIAASTLLHRRSTFTPTTTMLLVRGRRFRSTCPGPSQTAGTPPSTIATPSTRRTGEPKRRAFIPISSRQTSRVLNNVDLDDARVDVRIEDTLPFPARRRTASSGPMGVAALPLKECCAHSNSSTDSSLDGRSSADATTSVASTSSINSVRVGPGPSEWMCLRTPPSRYSASSFGSSCSAGSEEDIWVPRKNY